MAKLNVGLIGCGSLGTGYHLEHLMKMKDVKVAAVCDVIQERADVAGKKSGANAYTDYKEMLEKEKLDACFVAVPPAEHPDIELGIISKKINLHIQKPMTLSMEHAKKVEAAIKKTGIINAVGFQDRYLDVTEEIISFLKTRKTGLFRGAWLGGVPGVPWWQKKATCGGQIVEQNIHIYDMARLFFGEPTRVSGAGGTGLLKQRKNAVPDYFDLEEYTSVNIEFKNGVIGNMLTGCYLKVYAKNGMDIFTEDGCVYYTLRRSAEFVSKNNKSLKIDVANDQGFDCDRTFIEAVMKNDQSKIRSPYSDAIKTLKLTIAAQEAVETGKTIEL